MPRTYRRNRLPQALACKSIDRLMAEAQGRGHRLNKTLGRWSLTSLGIGAIIGSGIFVLTGTAAAGEHFSSPSLLHAQVMDLILSWFHHDGIQGALLHAFVLGSLGVLVLRRRQPDRRRGFRVPWVPTVPILSAALCAGLMTGLTLITWLRFVIWLVLGLVIYMIYSRKHSEFASPSTQPS